MLKVDENTKAMVAQLKAMKVEVSKTKELGLELSKSKGTMNKLQEDLDKQVAFLWSKAEENKTLSGWVTDLEQQVKDLGNKTEDLTSEKKIAEEGLRVAKDKIAQMKETVAKMESQLQKKEKVEFALKAELDEAKRLIVLNHREDFMSLCETSWKMDQKSMLVKLPLSIKTFLMSQLAIQSWSPSDCPAQDRLSRSQRWWTLLVGVISSSLLFKCSLFFWWRAMVLSAFSKMTCVALTCEATCNGVDDFAYRGVHLIWLDVGLFWHVTVWLLSSTSTMTSSAPITTLVIAFVVVGGVDVVGNGILLYQFLYQHVFVLSF